MNDSRLQPLLAIIPLASAGLYLLGFSYHLGYLGAFGIEDSLFPLASDRSLFFGFFAAVSMGLVPMMYLLFAFSMISILVALVVFLSSTSKFQLLKGRLLALIPKIAVQRTMSSGLGELIGRMESILVYLVSTIACVFLLALVTLFANKSGENQAFEEIDQFAKNEGAWAILYSSSLLAPTKVRQIYCSEAHCAFWVGDKSLIVRGQSIDRVELHSSFTKRLRLVKPEILDQD